MCEVPRQKVGELRALQVDVEASLEEVERTLAEEQPLLASRFGTVFRGLAEHFQPLRLFPYSLKTSSSQAVVTLNS